MTNTPLTLHLYNTESCVKEPLVPLEKGHIKMYTCGPTVYNFAHIGNFRTYIFEDLLRRAIKFFGMKITQAMNLTDVDDKTIKGALAMGITLDEYTQPYKDAFFEDLKTLNIEPVEHYPAATEYIAEMISMIHVLLENGLAYVGSDRSIYFAIRKFPRYGCLSHFCLEELQEGASLRVVADEYEKESASDFVLWKAYDALRDGNIFWESPFGPGRPGWHLECSAMAMKILGSTIDIHVGGIDNMFPHHENEIAQSEGCSGKKFVNVWMHSEHLVVDGKKMSKSLGNFYTLRDLLKRGYTGIQVRYMLLHTHYKTQLNFTFAGLDSMQTTLQRLESFILRMEEFVSAPSLNSHAPNSGIKVDEIINIADGKFSEALADDLNISLALGSLFDFIREINAYCDASGMFPTEAAKVIALLKRFDTVLGVMKFDVQEKEIPIDLQEALQKRIEARAKKDWALSDQLRDLIVSRGYVIEDTPLGPRLKHNV